MVTPVYRTRPDYLTAAINSVTTQTRSDWQLILVDDASGDPELARLLRSYTVDPRIIVRTRPVNGGIVAATNDALALATGELVAFLDHDDVLAPTALEAVHESFIANPTAEIFYSDRGHIDATGAKTRTFHKPDWSPERLRGNMYVAHLTVVNRRAAGEVGGMRAEFEGSQDHDLILRIAERGHPVVHIPEILYFWRLSEGSTASNPDAKPYARKAGLRAVVEHCRRAGIVASPTESASAGFYTLNRVPPLDTKVSIIIPTRGTRRIVFGSERCLVVEAVRSIAARDYVADYEIIVVHDIGCDDDHYLEGVVAAGDGRVRLISYEERFNFARKINLGALHAVGNVLLLLNDDVEVISPNWLDHLAALALEPDVGAVGAKLLFEDGSVQHAGIAIIPPGGMTNAGNGAPNQGGNFGSFLVDHEVMAVTGACLATKTTTFFELGGFSEDFAGSFNDADYCFKALTAGYRNVAANSVSLYHFESLTRDATVTVHEHATLLGRWRHLLRSDPYLRNAGFSDRAFRQRRAATRRSEAEIPGVNR